MKLLTSKRALCVLLAVGCLIASESTRVSAEPANAKITSPSPEVQPAAPLSQRFAASDAKDVPDFQKHVVPLMGRLGCNGRACHGSFQGRGGFQLSLFGYDFKADHEALLEEASGRVDVDDVDESLILAKPTDADMHEGGKRYDEGSWQHHVLRRWIESGANFDSQQIQTLVRLEVTPSEIQFASEGEQVELTAIAHWQDGTAEDVTELCRFSSNDDAIAEIGKTGAVKSGQRGDTHVVVYYDNAVIPVPVIRPIGDRQPFKSSGHPVDQLVQKKLDKLGITPSNLCTDAEFIRRVSLNITGILPSGEDVREFLADKSPDKREQLISELLDSPGYAAWWATRLSDWTGNSEEQLNNALPVRNGAAGRLWHEWLRARLDSNMPYDQIVDGIVTANSRQPEESYLEYCESMTKACVPGNEGVFAERDGMPLYWARRNFQKPEERAIGFAYTFLGVRIECAQCHKHPFDQWSKDDFEQFAKLFAPIRVRANQVAPDAKKDYQKLINKITGGKKLNGGVLRRKIYEAAKNGETVAFGELWVDTSAIDRAKKARAVAKKKGRKPPTVKIPEGRIIGQDNALALDQDPRGPLMDWLRSPENPYFAKAIVNRVWSNYFGLGIVNPTDDMNLANPPSNAALLDHLAEELIARDFDLKWLHTTITTSDTYQRSADTNSTNAMDRTNFSHHIPGRLPAEVAFDAVILATGSDELAGKLRGELDDMAIAEGKPRQRNRPDFALQVFGQSIRESNCDCDRSDAPSLLQSIYLRNDQDMHKRLADKNGWVAQACKSLGVSGPKTNDPAQLANLRRADGLRKQFVGRIRQFNKHPEERQKKLRPQLAKEHARAAKQFKKYGFKMPGLNKLIANPESWSQMDVEIETIAGSQGSASIEKIVEDAYLRTLSRFPDQEETDISIAFIEESKTPADGLQSLLWALVNTKEFIISH